MLLGNRQLLSGFFVIALLLGVAFGRGYIVGRNSIPSPRAQAEAVRPAPGSQDRPQPAPPKAKAADQQPPASAHDPAAAVVTQPAAGAEPTRQPTRDVAVAPAPAQTDSRPSSHPRLPRWRSRNHARTGKLRRSPSRRLSLSPGVSEKKVFASR